MTGSYIFEKVDDPKLMDESLKSIIQEANITSIASSNKFISYGDGIIDGDFYMGSLVTSHLKNISINNLTSYIFSIPKVGSYSIKNKKQIIRAVSSKSGAMALSTNKVIYNNSTDYVNDYAIIINKKYLNSEFEKKYNSSNFNVELLPLNIKSKPVKTCFEFIESSINILRNFPVSQKSLMAKKNIKEIAIFMLIEIIAKSINAKPLFNLNPEKYMVEKAEEIMEAECTKLFTIQEVADRVFTSPRNIQMAFRKYRNYSPMQFLKTRKLHEARKNILNSVSQKCMVKQIALEVGLFDLNRFSRSYAEVFGELPSQTIKKQKNKKS